MIRLSDYARAIGFKGSPEEYEQFRDEFAKQLFSAPEVAALRTENPQAYESLRVSVMEPDNPLLTMPKKGWFHPAVKTPMYMFERLAAGALPGYGEATRGHLAKKGMTEQQKGIEQAIWQRMGPQNKYARAGAAAGPYIAGMLTSGLGLAKGAAALMAKTAGAAAAIPAAGRTLAETARVAAPQMAAWGAGLGVMGGLRGLAQGQSPEEAAKTALKQGGIGAAIGGAAPVLGTLLSRVKQVPEAARLGYRFSRGELSAQAVQKIAAARLATAKIPKTVKGWTALRDSMRNYQLARHGEMLEQVQALSRVPGRLKAGAPQLPWQMTRTQFITQTGMKAADHTAVIEAAIKAGEPVPPGVLKEVPHLVKSYKNEIAAARGTMEVMTKEGVTQVSAEGYQRARVAVEMATRATHNDVFQTSLGVGNVGKEYLQTLRGYNDWLMRNAPDTKYKTSMLVDQGRIANTRGRVLGDNLRDRIYHEMGWKWFSQKARPQRDRVISLIDEVFEQDNVGKRAAAIVRLKVTKAELNMMDDICRPLGDRMWLYANQELADTPLGTLGYRKNYWPRQVRRPAGMTPTKFAQKVQLLQARLAERRAVPVQAGTPSMYRPRKLESFSDWVRTVEEMGLEPILDPAEAWGQYVRELHRAVGWRRLVQNMTGLRGPNQEPLFAIKGQDAVPDKFMPIFDPAFNGFAQRLAGTQTYQPIYAEPKIAKVINDLFVARQTEAGWANALSRGLSYYKQAVFYNPAIHGKNILSDFLDECNFLPWRAVKVFNQGRQIWRTGGEALEHALDAGLELGRISELQATALNQLPPVWGSLLSPARWGRIGFAAQQRFMFNKAIRYAQLGTWQMKVAQLTQKHAGVPQRAVEAAAAHFVNDLYGSLPANWMGVTTGKALNIALFARNWTLSNLDLVAKAALRRGLGSATMTPMQMAMIQGEYAAHLGKGLIGIFAQAELLTMGATAVWGEEGMQHLNHFPIDTWLQVHTGKRDTKGREISFGLPFFQYIRDILAWSPYTPLARGRWKGFGTAKTLYNKTNPVWKTLGEAVLDYSFWRGGPIAPEGANWGEARLAQLKYAAEAVPLLKPIAHVATGRPQPGVSEPRRFPALAYVLGLHLIHDWRGPEFPKLMDSFSRFVQRQTYERTRNRDKVDELLARGEHEQALIMWVMDGNDPRTFRDRVFRFACPELGMWRFMGRKNQALWDRQAPDDLRAELQEMLRRQGDREESVFGIKYRQAIGEELPRLR